MNIAEIETPRLSLRPYTDADIAELVPLIGAREVAATTLCIIFSGNSASGKLLVKLGMRHEGCMREHICKWGQFVDLECYGILRSDWESQPPAGPQSFPMER